MLGAKGDDIEHRTRPIVVPAQAGIQTRRFIGGAATSAGLDSRLRGNDGSVRLRPTFLPHAPAHLLSQEPS
ncbi:hypothetical protein DM480_09970 [Sphingomonas sp. FARSPH]|jgi:hypothetical protein|nr:hypothetical protein DM480_09970 [Sphingomonas sp. FARSPH]